MESRDNDGWTPLKLASQNGHLDVVRSLLQSAPPWAHVITMVQLVLMLASREVHLDIIRLLLQIGRAHPQQ
jgi:ankyrin repeat protein